MCVYRFNECLAYQVSLYCDSINISHAVFTFEVPTPALKQVECVGPVALDFYVKNNLTFLWIEALT
jgi:hypothetical protein